MLKKALWWSLVIAWCAVIFIFSGKPAVESSRQSLGVMRLVNSLLEGITGTGRYEVSESFVRKMAHFGEYFILGCLLYKALLCRKLPRPSPFLTVFLGMAYAVTDEIHQYFVPGRVMALTDVLVDTLGVMLAVAICTIIWRLAHRSTANS